MIKSTQLEIDEKIKCNKMEKTIFFSQRQKKRLKIMINGFQEVRHKIICSGDGLY